MGSIDLRALEGRTVSLSLVDGSRIDDCQLVSAPRAGVDGIWVHADGHDTIVPLDRVTDVWESHTV